jgi:hypothetical protein
MTDHYLHSVNTFGDTRGELVKLCPVQPSRRRRKKQVRVFIRQTAELNVRLREMMGHSGNLSGQVNKALVFGRFDDHQSDVFTGEGMLTLSMQLSPSRKTRASGCSAAAGLLCHPARE